MKARIYLMERSFLEQLLADRRELFAVARELHTAEAMREASEKVMASARIFLTPNADADPHSLYAIDVDRAAHIPMIGELTPAAKQDVCGAYTAEALTEYGFIQAAARAADADPRVEKIIFDANTPGGYLSEADQTAQVIAGLSKPTETHVRNMLASAGVLLASQTDRITASSPMDKIGSIGVAVEIEDESGRLAAQGVKRTVLTSTDAPNKNPDPMTAEGRKEITTILDQTHSVFVRRVAKGRGVSAEKVNADFGKGGIMLAEQALKVGLIDAVDGLSIGRHEDAETAGVAGDKTAAKADGISKTGGVKQMTPEELKKDHPDLYAAVVKDAREAGKVEGIAEGVAQERKRLEQLNAFRGINADGDKAVDAAIKEGKAYADVAPLLSAAVAKGGTKNADGDNPPDVATAAQGAGGGVAMTPELAGMAKSMGVTGADIAKFSGEKKGA